MLQTINNGGVQRPRNTFEKQRIQNLKWTHPLDRQPQPLTHSLTDTHSLSLSIFLNKVNKFSSLFTEFQNFQFKFLQRLFPPIFFLIIIYYIMLVVHGTTEYVMFTGLGASGLLDLKSCATFFFLIQNLYVY